MSEDKRRLYEVDLKVSLVALVLANDEEDARLIARYAFQDMDGAEDPTVTASEVSDERVKLPPGWAMSSPVYHTGSPVDELTKAPIDVETAMEIHRSNRKDSRQVDMFLPAKG